MIRILNKLSTWKIILPVFVVSGSFPFVVFPIYESKFAALAGEVVQPLDTRFHYTTDEVRVAFEKLGAEGREMYGFVLGFVDMIYPVAYGLLFVLLLASVVKRTAGRDSRWILISLLPLLAVVFDFLENFNTLRMLRGFPVLQDEHVRWGEKMTQLKYGALLISAGLIVVLSLVVLFGKIRNRPRRT